MIKRTFKDMVKSDVKNVFMNPEEFGESHTVDGKEMSIIVDDNELIDREKKIKTMAEGLHKKRLLIHVSAEDFGSEPLIGRILELDGDYYEVADVSDEMGIYAITLEANRS